MRKHHKEELVLPVPMSLVANFIPKMILKVEVLKDANRGIGHGALNRREGGIQRCYSLPVCNGAAWRLAVNLGKG